MTFATRLEAADAPARLQDLGVIDHAVSVLMARDHIREHHARERLAVAAARAGVPVVALARAVLDGDGRVGPPSPQNRSDATG
ncbi:ANTAR domain-containing protein [Terrabacter sp. NPDC080008]|uniref:ANTAR domain-containing protein n=1 Tax=Terrabacter sp. NPDC080008 TaxID=3155176 RepID=UPI00344C959C